MYRLRKTDTVEEEEGAAAAGAVVVVAMGAVMAALAVFLLEATPGDTTVASRFTLIVQQRTSGINGHVVK